MDKEIEKEIKEKLDKHLYTCADYEISSEKIDNEILKTTGQAIEDDIISFVSEKIDHAIQQERERIEIEEFRKGYNQCLKDEGKVGERWQHKYL